MSNFTPKTTVTSSKPSLIAGKVERLASLLIVLIVALGLFWGWSNRAATVIDPEQGFGYALGIIGGILMIILLGYPLRKRAKPGRRAPGSVGFWFRLHMVLGLLGPLAILYHARFSWGALNSAVALGAMIVVASSGLVGRFFYGRVHRGYSGRKIELRTLRAEMVDLLDHLVAAGVPQAAVEHEFHPYELRAAHAGRSFWTSAAAVLGLSFETRLAERRLRARLRQAGQWSEASGDVLSEWFRAVRRVAEFAFYDRLLRLWHLLHMPLFILMVAAVILHIVAVHMY
jgi:hypothetical protein